MINRAFQALGRNLGLITIPVVMDLVSFFLGFVILGFSGESGVTLKLILGVGVPSIASVLDDPVMAGGLYFDLGVAAIILFVVFLVISAFVEAGYFGLIVQLAKLDEAPTLHNFLDYAKRFWLRFLGLRLLVFVVIMAGVLLSLILGIIGIIAYTIGFMVLRILYIYWELTLVSEDLSIGEAFSHSRQHFGNRTPELVQVIIAMLVVNLVAGLFLNLLMHPVVIFLGIFIYSYAATGMLLALMYTKPDGIPVQATV